MMLKNKIALGNLKGSYGPNYHTQDIGSTTTSSSERSVLTHPALGNCQRNLTRCMSHWNLKGFPKHS